MDCMIEGIGTEGKSSVCEIKKGYLSHKIRNVQKQRWIRGCVKDIPTEMGSEGSYWKVGYIH